MKRFDICKQTASIASSQCVGEAATPTCHCSAEKQLLACYSECVDDLTVSGVVNEQKQIMQTACDQPGAEAEIKMRPKNHDLVTMGDPVQLTEPFKVKPKPQSVDSSSEDGIIHASSHSTNPSQDAPVKEDSEMKKAASKETAGTPSFTQKDHHENANNVSMNGSGSLINPIGTITVLPLCIFALSSLFIF
ncbi:hypothetical protein BC941DRAFT_426260 [Chlamydoabsidia padenii]|nr:hypothetical protein BC941DRAFT_426260 [Chlamydoabsidia padenii]